MSDEQMEPSKMSDSNCGCCCAYQTPPWWVTMRFTDAGPAAPTAPPAQAAPPATQPTGTQPSGSSGDSGLGGILNTVGGALGGVLGGLI
jgi:hypothetical protein